MFNLIKNGLIYLYVTFGAIAVLVFFAFIFAIGGICMHYDIHYWAVFVKHQEVAVPWVPCILLGWLVSSITIPVAIGTWVFSFFV